MARAEKLPSGIDRRDSGALRARVRLLGYPEETKHFPLFEDSAPARARQLADAIAWQQAVTIRMQAGTHVSVREAESLRLRDALERFRDQGLGDRRPGAQKVAKLLIGVLLRDPIADRPLAAVSTTDVASLRDRLIQRGRERSRQSALKQLRKLEPSKAVTKRIEALEQLPRLQGDTATKSRAAEVAAQEGIKDPAPSTVKNTVQLVNRALKFMGERVAGVAPAVRGVSLPKARPGRTRRPTLQEVDRLLTAAGEIDPLAPLIIRFAILTALRRERCLSVRTSNIVDVGNGCQVVSFGREPGAKKVGIIPVTADIRTLMDEAMRLRPDASNDRLVFKVPIETFERWFEKAIAAAGIKDLHFHDLRHEATSRLFEAGLNTAEVMSITGHTTTEMVERYSHYSAVLVLEKLERNGARNPEALLEEVALAVERYRRSGGDPASLTSVLALPPPVATSVRA